MIKIYYMKLWKIKTLLTLWGGMRTCVHVCICNVSAGAHGDLKRHQVIWN